MAFEAVFNLIKQNFSPDDGKAITRSLNQDPLVWNFFQDEASSLPFISSNPKTMAAFSPGEIALWLLQETTSIPQEDLRKDDIPLPKEIRLKAARAFESTLSTGLPPVDLNTAGLLALTLRERRLIKGNWEGIAKEIFIKREKASIESNFRIWRTPVACLRSLSVDFDNFILEFLHAEDKSVVNNFIPILIHAFLANPERPNQILEKLHSFIAGLPIDLQLESLQWIDTAKQTWLCEALAKALIRTKPILDFSAQIFSEYESFDIPPKEKDPLIRSLRFNLPEDLNRLGALYYYAGDHLKAGELYRNAADLIEFLQLKTEFQALSNLSEANQNLNLSEDWQTIATEIPESDLAQFASAKYLIENKLFDAATPVINKIQSPSQKNLLEYHMAKAKQNQSQPRFDIDVFTLTFENHDGFTESPYFIRNLKFIDPVKILKESIRNKEVSINPESIEKLLDAKHNDPELIILARDLYSQAHFFGKAIELTRYLELIEPEVKDHKRSLAKLLENAERWQEAYATYQELVKAEVSPPTSDLTGLAKAALHSDRLDVGISICQSILKNEPKNTKALVLLGEGFMLKGDVVKAIQHMEKVVEMIPSEPETWLTLSRLWKESGQTERALDMLNKGVLAIPDCPDLLRPLGETYLKMGAPADALSFLKRAHEIDPENISGKLSLARADFELGRYERAWKILEPFMETYDQDPEVAKLLGHVLLAVHNKEKAEPILSYAAANDPFDLETLFAYAELVIENAEINPESQSNEKLVKVQSLLRKSATQRSENNRIPLLMADLDRLMGENQSAFDVYLKLSESPSIKKSLPEWRLQYGLGKSAIALNQYDLGLTTLQEAATLQPENLYVIHGLAEAFSQSNLRKRANDTAKTALRLAPNDYHNIIWYAQFKINNNEPEEAIQALKEALLLQPNRAELRLRLAKILISVGEGQESQKEITTLINDPETPSATLHKAAYVAIQLNKLDLATKALKDAQKKIGDPNPVLLMDLAMAYSLQGKRKDALEILNVDHELMEENPQLLLLKSDLLANLGQFEIARKTLESLEDSAEVELQKRNQIVDLQGSSPLLYSIDLSLPGFYIRLAQLCRCLGDFQKAKQLTKLAVDISPTDTRVRLAYVESHYVSIDFSKALQLIEGSKENPDPSSTRQTQDDLDIICTQAEIHLYQGDVKTAMEIAEQVNQSSRNYPRYLALQTRLAVHLGDDEIANDYLAEAIQSYRENLSSEKMSSPREVLRQVMSLNAIADGALAMNDYTSALEIHNEALGKIEGQPLQIWRYAVALVEAATDQRIADVLSATSHSPGINLTDQATYNHFQKMMDNLNVFLPQNEWMCLKARGDSAFVGHWNLYLNIESCLKDPRTAVSILIGSDDPDLVNQVKNSFPNNPDVLQAVGINAHIFGKVPGIDAVEKCLQLEPANPLNHVLLGLLQKDDPSLSLKLIETALDLWPNEPEWHALAADLQMELGESEAASKHIQQALEFTPESPTFWQKSAEIKLKHHDISKAKEDLEKSAAYQSDNPNIWLKLADINSQIGNFSEALENLQKALDIDPKNQKIRIKEANLLLQENQIEAAESKAKEILDENPDELEAHIILAKAEAKRGKFEHALVKMDEMILDHPENSWLRLERLKIREKWEGPEIVLPETITLAQDNPTDAKILTYLTNLLIQTNRLEKAQETAQTVLKILPDAPEVHLMLGRLQRKSGQLDQAISHFSTAITFNPHLVDAYLELGKTYQERRDLEEAINIYKKAAEVNSHDPRPFFNAAMALKESKDYQAAETMLKQAKRIAPEDPNIIRQLGVITALNLINNLRETR